MSAVTTTPPAPAADVPMHSPADAVPLTEAQEGLWYAQQLDPGNPLFNTGHCTEIRGALDRARFGAAIGQTLAEADALALNFRDGDAGPRQWIDAGRRPRLEHVALPATAAAVDEARQWMRRDLETPVDPRTAPLARHVLFSLGEEHHYWYQRVHHLAADGYGMALIESRALQLYRQSGGAGGPGKPLTPFARVVADDAAYRASAQRRQDATFWRDQLDAAQGVASLAEASAMSAHGILQARLDLPAATIALLQQRQATAQCAWPAILTALVAAYVQRHTGQEPVVIGAPWMGRMGNVSARCVATVMNVMPMRLALDQDAPLDEIFRRCAQQLALAHRHGRYRSEQLRRDLGLPGGQGRIHGPLVNILPFDAAYRMAGLDAHQEVLCAGPVDDFNFNFRAAPDASDMRLELEANPKLYGADAVQQHLARLAAFLHAALQAQTLRPVQTLHGAEFQHWVHDVNQTAHAVPDTTLVALVAQTCAQYPQAEALRMEGRSIDFAGFDALVGRAARRLQAAGVGRGDIVAVALPRSLEMVLSLHAVQRAGAAWLPLDTEQPAARSARILGVAQPAALIGDAGTLAGLEHACPALPVDDLFAPAAEGEAADAAVLSTVEPGDAAYVIFTSGSTGEPKGVVVSHRAIVNRLLWMRRHYGLGAGDRFLQKTPYTFDVAVWELFLPMLCGAPLVVAPPGVHRDPLALAGLIRREDVGVVHFVPSMLAAFLDEPASHGLALRLVFCSGEALPARLRDRFHAHLDADLHNLYGPTEAAVDVSWWPASADDRSDPVPIGYPVWNTQLHILDACGRPLPPGVRGQLYLAGVQLADGYLGRPELTAARFVANPFSDQAGTRMYDTGDLARWRADGAVEYLGRADHQVKLRGQRIELGEIEAVLGRHPLCRQLAVVLRQDAAGETRLIAYVVPPAGHPAGRQAQDGQALLDHARRELPPAMVPSAVVWMAALPLSRNGKLDSKALPAPDFAPQARRPATTALELEVAHAFRQILGLSALPGADDDFFALGGHSLLAARLASALRQRDGGELTLGAVFEHSTVARLAAWLEHLATDTAAGGDAGFGPLFTLRAPTVDAAPALFCIHPAGGLSWCYGPMARRLPVSRPVHGLQSPVLAGAHLGIGSLRELAARYVDRLQALQAHGPYHLLGWSVGGIIAQDMACVLRERGAEVGIVALLDAYPSEAWRARPPAAADDAWRAILHIAGFDPASLPGLELGRDSVIAFLRQRGHPLGALADPQLHGILEAVAFNNALVRGHRQRRYDGELLYFRAALDHQDDGLDARAWEPWAAGLSVHDVPALHGDLPGPAALACWLPVLAARLQDAGPAHTPPAG